MRLWLLHVHVLRAHLPQPLRLLMRRDIKRLRIIPFLLVVLQLVQVARPDLIDGRPWVPCYLARLELLQPLGFFGGDFLLAGGLGLSWVSGWFDGCVCGREGGGLGVGVWECCGGEGRCVEAVCGHTRRGGVFLFLFVACVWDVFAVCGWDGVLGDVVCVLQQLVEGDGARGGGEGGCGCVEELVAEGCELLDGGLELFL